MVQCLKSKTRFLHALHVRYTKYRNPSACWRMCHCEKKTPKQVFFCIRTAKLICKLISWVSYSDPIGKKIQQFHGFWIQDRTKRKHCKKFIRKMANKSKTKNIKTTANSKKNKVNFHVTSDNEWQHQFLEHSSKWGRW